MNKYHRLFTLDQQFAGIIIHLLQVFLQFLRFLLIFYNIFLKVSNLLLRFVFVSVLQHSTRSNSTVLLITISTLVRH